MSNSISLRPLKANSAEIEQAIALYLEAFPPCERRDTKEWLACLDEKSGKPFTLFGIFMNNDFMGFFTCWNLADFIYGEHFAVNTKARGNGIGAKTVNALKEHYAPLPIVLEVEVPNEEMAIRRVGFYQRQGFHLNEAKYLQPPYREGDEWLELKLMSNDPDFLEANLEHVRNQIYQIAYNVKPSK